VAKEKLPFLPLERLYQRPALIAEVAGVTLRTIVRWKAGGVPVEVADRLAVWRGLHPAEVWSEW